MLSISPHKLLDTAVIRHAYPFALGVLLLNLSPFLNMLFTAQLGTNALASMGSISLILFFPKTFIYAVSYAVQIYTARDLGKGSHLNALISGLILCCIISLLSLCFLYTFEAQILRHFLPQDTFSDDVRIYFRLQICSFFLASLILTLRGFFSAFNENSLFFYIVVLVVSCQLF
ncbi:MAG: MATE family efflux transporter, partial [Pseudomonadota bacterium]|nr:MATE family efflux transporter [Pseudomonadota bacterium]